MGLARVRMAVARRRQTRVDAQRYGGVPAFGDADEAPLQVARSGNSRSIAQCVFTNGDLMTM